MISATLAKRTVSTVVLAPLVLAAIWQGSWAFWAMLLVAFAISVYEWLSVAQKTDIAFPASIFGIVYPAFSITCFALLREEGMWLVLALILAVWASDICAYAAGKTIGGPKMAPVISPNKTWAGFAGAVAGAVAVTLSLHLSGVLAGGIAFAALGGALIGLGGQGGDLLVSMLKRRAGVKDMGALIPGHGGLLDRIDSLLMACPLFFLLLYLGGALT